MKEFNRFALVGFLNTFVGYCLFYFFLKYFFFSPAISNFLSYILIIIFSFSIYKDSVFINSELHKFSKLFYVLSFSCALTCNQVVLYLFKTHTMFIPEIYQIFGMGTYTVVFYFLNKKFVFVS